jgi:hypothetical protein
MTNSSAQQKKKKKKKRKKVTLTAQIFCQKNKALASSINLCGSNYNLKILPEMHQLYISILCNKKCLQTDILIM